MLNRNLYTRDAQQQAMSFLVQQASYIEQQVYRIQYPDIQYPSLVPVTTEAPEWTKSITFYSQDAVGRADWFHQRAKDMPLADVTRGQHEETVELAGIGYRYDLAEINTAMMQGINLPSDKAAAAYRAYEEFVDEIAIVGDTDKGKYGLTNNPNVTIVNAASGGTAPYSPSWLDKTTQEILNDVNDLLTGAYTASQTVELADTLLLPISVYSHIATLQMPNLPMTVLEWISRYNVYTQQTGQPLMVRGIRRLDTAGVGGTGRIVAYRRDPLVVRMHIPMPHMFLQPFQTGPLIFDVPGIFRLGGVEIRRPSAFRYLDHILHPSYA